MTYKNDYIKQMVLVIDEQCDIPTVHVELASLCLEAKHNDVGVHVLFSFEVPEKGIKQSTIKKNIVREERIPGVNPKKRNKIIGNTYKSGDNLKGDEYKFDHELKVDAGYASNYLGSIYDVENNMTFKKVQEEVMILIEGNAELQDMISDAKPKKFNREKVNRMFKIIYEHFEKKPEVRQFSNLIYIFDNVSNLSGLKYASLYDLLDGEYKQMLLLELDKTYGILKNSGKSNRLF